MVTGASSGIGRATAIALAESGWSVAAFGRDPARVAETVGVVESTGGRARAYVGDLRAEGVADSMIDDVEADMGPVGGLVNSAGVFVAAPFLSTTEGQWRAVFESNVFTVVAVTQAILHRMVARDDGGAVVNLSSTYGLSAAPSPYSASKWALEGLTRCLAEEFRDRRIRVNAVAPGPTLTAMTGHGSGGMDGHERPAGFATPAEIAAAVTFLLSERAGHITGETLVVDGGRGLSHRRP